MKFPHLRSTQGIFPLAESRTCSPLGGGFNLTRNDIVIASRKWDNDNALSLLTTRIESKQITHQAPVGWNRSAKRALSRGDVLVKIPLKKPPIDTDSNNRVMPAVMIKRMSRRLVNRTSPFPFPHSEKPNQQGHYNVETKSVKKIEWLEMTSAVVIASELQQTSSRTIT